MNIEIEFKASDYWNNLSPEERIKILREYNFWLGFSTYLYQYIPEDLKTVIMLKIDCKEQLS